MKKFWIVLIALFVSVSAFADTLRLTDGTVVKGTIVSQDAQKVIIDSDLGRMEVPRYKVASMDFGNSVTPAAAAAAPAAAATPNIVINQNVTQNATAGGGEGGASSETARKQAVVKIERMVRAKDFLNKKKAKAMSEQAALLPYEYRALLLDKHLARGSFGYGLLNILPGVGSFMQGDIAGALISYAMMGGGMLISASLGKPVSYIGDTLTTIGYIWNLFRPGGYEKFYNKSLREGLAVYYSQLPSLEMPLFTSQQSGIQVPVVSFEF